MPMTDTHNTTLLRSFDTEAGVWQTIDLPFSSFFPVFRAKTLTDGTPLDPAAIRSLQLMLSKFEYDGNLNPAFTPGAFAMPVQRIEANMPSNLVRQRWCACVCCCMSSCL